jgi:hypothetical protein
MSHRHRGRIIPVLIFICAIRAFNQQSYECDYLHFPIRGTLGLLMVPVFFSNIISDRTGLAEILLNLTLTNVMCKSL